MGKLSNALETIVLFPHTAKQRATTAVAILTGKNN